MGKACSVFWGTSTRAFRQKKGNEVPEILTRINDLASVLEVQEANKNALELKEERVFTLLRGGVTTMNCDILSFLAPSLNKCCGLCGNKVRKTASIPFLLDQKRVHYKSPAIVEVLT